MFLTVKNLRNKAIWIWCGPDIVEKIIDEFLHNEAQSTIPPAVFGNASSVRKWNFNVIVGFIQPTQTTHHSHPINNAVGQTESILEEIRRRFEEATNELLE